MNEKFTSLVIEFLGDEVKEYEVYGDNEIILNLKDVNFEIKGSGWETMLKDQLKKFNINIDFSYGNENWVTVQAV